MATDVPEAYGGLELDKVSSILVAEGVARSASFATTFGAMTGLAIMPLLCFGTEAQKARYLPGLVTGELVGAYALSESGSGSDALGARARATRLEDGSFSLTGEKMWITNGGFADVFIVFAKVDGRDFTAFIVERAFPGVSSGREEHKMGLHGSSTAPLILQDARVPAENVLGEIGKGHKVAFNMLNYGRFKLGAMASGRRQDGDGRGGGLCGDAAAVRPADRRVRRHPVQARRDGDSHLRAREPAASDGWPHRRRDCGAAGRGRSGARRARGVRGGVVDGEGLRQRDGGLRASTRTCRFTAGTATSATTRPSATTATRASTASSRAPTRSTGCSSPGMLMRRAVKGDLALIDAAKRLQDEIMSPSLEPPGDGLLDAEQAAVRGFKKVALAVLGTAMQTYGDKVTDEQEVLSWTADILIDALRGRERRASRARGGRGARRGTRRCMRPRHRSSWATPRCASRPLDVRRWRR